jgi:hypothetical protein
LLTVTALIQTNERNSAAPLWHWACLRGTLCPSQHPSIRRERELRFSIGGVAHRRYAVFASTKRKVRA